ncbi:hypothetical protein NMY3_01175 [Candidatus Nitrosocosmicus oleophilus]|jgi:hypothetical protein|uniref:Uncharacterized protein n=1 Tax=Candidatus Nitrosocosmicus oleophilus TaxID=1353260 RepID=A0A654LX37_9ARCH|nr:hypothetical protein NMY3_01175 [Candidatus Nitrosocosmicus oleophilus]
MVIDNVPLGVYTNMSKYGPGGFRCIFTARRVSFNKINNTNRYFDLIGVIQVK